MAVHAEPITLDPKNRYLLNPGSVGQPRDGNPLASFATLEYISAEEEAVFTVFRTDYDIKAAQAETHKVGLPANLADRLDIGS
jgi:diadenosine tetraphosphatase ApaH/serine/threonine PP2A family protein phosphatase